MAKTATDCHNGMIIISLYGVINRSLCVTDRSKAILLWWFFLFYVLVFKMFLCCWCLMCVFIVLVKLR